MLYRSRVTRWSLAAVALWIAYILIFGDPATWHSTPSLEWANRNVHVPFWMWGIGFAAYGLLLLPVRTRPAAFAIGAVLFAVFTVSLIVTIHSGGPKSAIAIGGLVDLVVFHCYAVRTAMAANFSEGEGR